MLNSTLASSSDTILSNVTYQPFGPVKSFSFGNGGNYQRSYDLDGRMSAYNLGAKAS